MRHGCLTLVVACLMATTAHAVAPAEDRIDGLHVIPLHHATFALRGGKNVIYVDPVGGASRFENLPPPKLILITDIHPDHLDADTIKAVRDPRTLIVAPPAVATRLESAGIGRSSIQVLPNGATIRVADVGIEAVPMYNLTPERLRYHEQGRGNGYVVALAGKRIYISGDTEDIPEMRRLRHIDVAFVCMNLPFTMTAEQAADAVREMEPKIVYPYHYRSRPDAPAQDPARFKAVVEAASKSIEVRLRDWYALR